MGCQICKMCKKTNAKKVIKPKRYRKKKAKTIMKNDSRAEASQISLNSLRVIFGREKSRIRSNQIHKSEQNTPERRQGDGKIMIKKMKKPGGEGNKIITNEEKFIEDFREFKRNGINSKLDFEEEKKIKEKKPIFLRNYDVLLHNRINLTSFKSKEFLKVMPSSFLERSKQLGSTTITSEMIENELRRSVSSRKGRQRYYRTGKQKYDTFKKSLFRKAFELNQLKNLQFFSGRKKKKKQLSFVDIKNKDGENTNKNSEYKKRKNCKSMSDLGKLNNRIKELHGNEESITKSNSKDSGCLNNNPNKIDYYTSGDEESSNLEDEMDRGPGTFQSFYDLENDCEVLEIENHSMKGSSSEERVGVFHSIQEFARIDEESAQRSRQSPKLEIQEEFLESSESEEIEESDNEETLNSLQESLPSDESSSNSEDNETSRSEISLEDLEEVLSGKNHEQTESSFDIDIPLHTEDSMLEGEFALKLDNN